MTKELQYDAYVGIRPCGCVVCACVDRPEDKKQTAKTVSTWIQDGLRIERIPVEIARGRLTRCNHKKVKP
jgi:hypothetical protein